MSIILVVISAFLSGCEAMDSILPSAGHYKVNIHINDVSLNECSFIKLDDNICPYFEEPISDDKDVTALIIFIRDSAGEIIGQRVSYSINPETSNDRIIYVESLDEDLPPFPMPNNLPVGRYTLVFHVMGGKDILQKTESSFFYLGRNNFSSNGINVNIPGIANAPLLIPKETNIMLEASLDFDYRLNPYIIWYDGKRKISEGKISDGAGTLFWQVPEQSGFFSIRAEVFPIDTFDGLTGYQNEISMLVSSKFKDFNLLENIHQLIHWYTFEGNLNDSKQTVSAERILKPAAKNIPVWKGINGTYGLVTGQNNAFNLPRTVIPNNNSKIWQMVFRFKALDDGVILSVLFNESKNVHMSLIKEGQNLILILQSPLEKVTQVLSLPVNNIESEFEQELEDPFIIAGINFSILPNQLSAQLNFLGVTIENELSTRPISLKTSIKDEFRIMLGFSGEKKGYAEELSEDLPELKKTLTALWDEFALYYMPPMETIIAKLRPMVNEY